MEKSFTIGQGAPFCNAPPDRQAASGRPFSSASSRRTDTFARGVRGAIEQAVLRIGPIGRPVKPAPVLLLPADTLS